MDPMLGLCGQIGLSLRVPYGLPFLVPKSFGHFVQLGPMWAGNLIRLIIMEKKNVFTVLARVIIYVKLHGTHFTGKYHLLIT